MVQPSDLFLLSTPSFRTHRWFNISFDHFGRTSTDKQTEITQDIYLQVRKNNMLLQKSEEMTYCTGCERFVCRSCGSLFEAKTRSPNRCVLVWACSASLPTALSRARARIAPTMYVTHFLVR